MSKPIQIVTWSVVILLALVSISVMALSRGENINAAWLLTAAICIYFISYRFYGLYIAKNVLGLNQNYQTPAYRHNDGLDYVPTNKYVLFGHHFAAIAGAGPLVGPILAAQMGYLPSTLWILIGVILAGAVQDMTVLFVSVRRDGKTLGDIVRMEMGEIAGTIAHIGVFLIVLIVISVLALVVVKALTASPWGTFTIAATIPTALIMGIYGRYIRPGKIGEMSLIGLVLLLLALHYGQNIADSPLLAPYFTYKGESLALMIILYGALASILPVWLLLAPRDYLSTFMKIGVLALAGAFLFFVHPTLKMPAITQFIHGGGPVFAGSLFPFLFITIACGSVSGFHALISSGTTPKMLENETQIPFIGYGAMLMESFVAMMALISACILDPGVYYAINSPASLIGTDVIQASHVISSWGFALTPDMLTSLARNIHETSVLSRAGGAPTLAIGLATVFSKVLGGEALMGLWYHFAILFEALFILTAVDAGTRACRYMLQDMIPVFRRKKTISNNIITTCITVAMWGYILYSGTTDPLGGVNTLWPLFGISNQMLAGIALIAVSVVLFKMKRHKLAWVSILPAAWLTLCTVYASCLKLLSPDPSLSYTAHLFKFKATYDANIILAPAKTLGQMLQIIINDTIDSALSVIFLLVLVASLYYGIKVAGQALKVRHSTAVEIINVTSTTSSSFKGQEVNATI